jgi:membrane protein implicated in regulation of membrane protease activity
MVEAETIAMILIVMGAIFLIAEALSPGVFLLIPGTVLLILGIVGYIVNDFLYSVYSPILIVAVGIPVTIGTVKMYQILAKPEPPTTLVMESLLGMEGTVTVATEPGNIKGKVMIGTEIWSATSSGPIEAGAEVVVVKSKGVHVTVARK